MKFSMKICNKQLDIDLTYATYATYATMQLYETIQLMQQEFDYIITLY
jgi:hypothetical protein